MIKLTPVPNNRPNPNPYTLPLSKHDLLDHLAPLLDKTIIDGIGYASTTFDDENNLIVRTTPEHPGLPETVFTISVRKKQSDRK